MPIEIFVLILLAVTFFFIVLFQGRAHKRLNTVIEALGFKPKRIFLSSQRRETFQGEPIKLEISKDVLRILFPLTTAVSFTIRKKGDAPSWESGKQIKTGQADFDAKFSIITHAERETMELFLHSEVRTLLDTLFNGWIEEVECDGDHLQAAISIQSQADPLLLQVASESLLKLKRLLEGKQTAKETKWGSPSRLTLYFLYAFPLLLAIAQIVLAVWLPASVRKDFEPTNSVSLVLKSIIISSPLILLYLYVSFAITRRYPASGKKFYACLLFAFIWFLSAFPFSQGVNGYFDRSALREVSYTVVDKIPSKKGQTFLLILEEEGKKKDIGEDIVRQRLSRLFSSGTVKLAVKRSEYLRAKPGQTQAKVFLRAGALGVTWIDGYALSEGKIGEVADKGCHDKAFNLYKSGHLDEAIDEYTKCIAVKGEDGLLYYNRGVAYRQKGLHREALQDFERAIELNPEMIKAYQNIDWILAQKKEWPRIVALWSKYIAIKSQDPEGYYERAGAFYQDHQMEKAMEDLKKACALGKREACDWLKKKGLSR